MARRIDHYLRPLLPEEKFDFYEVVRDFADSEIEPKLLDWEREHVLLPDDVIAKMADLGLFGLLDRRELRRPGRRPDRPRADGTRARLPQPLSAAITPGAAISLGAKPLQLCGTEEQKRRTCRISRGQAHVRLRPQRARPRLRCGEPGGARREGRQRLGDQGEKCWSTNATGRATSSSTR
jgi:alkylation response protein AidB-like acyl-CoA dehydrogenase